MRYFRALMAIATGALTALPLAAQDSPPLDPDIPPTVVRTGPSLDDRVTIPINIDGKGPWNFVIVTGSQRTVIARALGADPVPETQREAELLLGELRQQAANRILRQLSRLQ